MSSPYPHLLHSSHWGAFGASAEAGRLSVVPHRDDPSPSPLLGNIPAAASPQCRVARPMVRKGWLEKGPGPDARRGADAFIPMEWPRVLDLVAAELRRVVDSHTNEAVFGGSYGWSSAGRFHHAQSQIHRFLNTAIGGYCRSVGNYSAGAAQVIAPYVIGPVDSTNRWSPIWGPVLENTELIVAFGGMAPKNGSVSGGGVSRHQVVQTLDALAARGVAFVLLSPLRADMPETVDAEWLPLRPASDTALMLGLAHTLLVEDLHDRDFLGRFCVGFERFERYLLGKDDGIPKSAEWAGALSEIPAATIAALARRMAASRTLVTVSQSVQRAEHGEQPVWAAITLAAMLGQIGLPGRGFVYGLGSMGNVGKPPVAVPLPTLAQGSNGASGFIPVARIADMLLRPGEPFSFMGRQHAYPHVRLIYWAGGNPFHHHQDLGRLTEAFSRPDTVIVNEPYWTSTARHADIVLPATVTLERDDIGAAPNDPRLLAMRKIVQPFGQARDEFDIFSDLAARLGAQNAYTEGRSAREWLAHIYGQTRAALDERGLPAPDFDEFWARGELDLPLSNEPGPIEKYRTDPVRHPLATPTGKIEIFSEMIAGYGRADIPGHASWLEPEEWLAGSISRTWPLQLISNQPSTRLHSQLDFGETSLSSKIQGREPLLINPRDAERRGITDGSIVRVFNARGSFLAGARVSADIRPQVVQIATGAWYDPREIEGFGLVCVHGNPNAVTRDKGTSSLAQGCTGQLTMVEIELFRDELPELRCHTSPGIGEAYDK